MTEVSAPLAFVTLPKPPSLNGLFRNTGKRHTVAHARQAPRAKSKAYLSWIAAATVELRAYRLDRVKGPYALSIQLGRRKGSDLDNYAKAISDLLVSMQIVQDDSLCELLVIGWADDLPANRCRIGVERARVATPAPKPKASARIVAEKKARAVMPKLNDFGAGKPVQFLVGQGYNHFEMLETLASPYGLLGRAALFVKFFLILSLLFCNLLIFRFGIRLFNNRVHLLLRPATHFHQGIRLDNGKIVIGQIALLDELLGNFLSHPLNLHESFHRSLNLTLQFRSSHNFNVPTAKLASQSDILTISTDCLRQMLFVH
jgi:Holliday junction resolvase RusA-like endonuclease